jgi:glycosyltransferase involved in cell wall biosynthesis
VTMTEREELSGFRVSVVTPVFNEAQNLPVLYERLKTVFSALDLDWEWVLVDDRSTDGSFSVIQGLAKESPVGRIKGYRFARNSGSHTAIMCGFENASGRCAIILAGDCQDPPETIPGLLGEWRKGHSVVWAVRRKRKGESPKNLAFARLYYWLMRRFVGIRNMPDSGADFFLLDRRAMDSVIRYREQNVSVLALLSWIGFSQGYIEYDKEERLHGTSGWNLEKKLKLVADSVTSFTYAPVRFMSYLGFLVGGLGFCYAALVVYNAITSGMAPEGWSSLMVVVLIMGGAQMIMMGVLGEYLWRALDESRRRPRYIVERDVGTESLIPTMGDDDFQE